MRVSVVAALGFAACSPSPPGGLPCGPNGECPSGQTCDVASNVCNGDSDFAVMRDDSAADFNAGLYLDEVTIEPGGFVAPLGFFTGGVLVSGIDGVHISDPSDAKFDMILGQNPIVDRTVIRTLDIDYAGVAPLGVGITSIDDFTIVVEGEIELGEAGTWTLELTANDRGFFDIAPPGDNFTRVLADTAGAPETADFNVTTPGWHRFRAMFADAGGDAFFRLRADAPGPSGGLQDIGVDQMRVRADALQGVVIDGFEHPFCVNFQGTVQVDALDQTYGTDPFGLPVGIGGYTIRSSAQLLIDTTGDYAFQITTLQGARVWLDGVQLVDEDASPDTVTTPVRLDAGWHDLVIDVLKDGGTGDPSLAFAIASGPTTGPIPADHLRPVVGRAQRFVEDESNADQAIPDDGSVTKTVAMTLPSGFVPERIDIGMSYAHPVPGSLGLVAVTPQGTTITLAAVGQLSSTSTTRLNNPALAEAGATWQFTASDSTLDAQTGTVTFASVTMLGRTGVAPFATSYRYESAVRDLGDIVRFDVMTWTVRQGERSAVAMQVRSCETAPECASLPWTDVADGSVPSVEVRRFVQYGATITTNGDLPTALDAVELRYVLAQ